MPLKNGFVTPGADREESLEYERNISGFKTTFVHPSTMLRANGRELKVILLNLNVQNVQIVQVVQDVERLERFERSRSHCEAAS